MGERRSGRALPVVLSLLALTGCSASGADTSADPPAASASAAATASATPTTPATTTAPPAPPNPVSLQALMQKTYDGRDLQVGQVLARTDAYTRYFVTYLSGGLRISGIMNVPTGSGPFPVLVLGHGYIDPAVYTNGRGMAREQDLLARRGFVVLHTDYRNHAQSDDDPTYEVNLRLGYTEDVVNAVLALKGSGLPYVDPNRVALMGRSMGGGVMMNALVVQPGLVDAAVVYAPVSSDTVDNFNKWTRESPAGAAIIATHGAPEANPGFWRDVSPVTFFDRITEPLLVQHGTADESCPIEWSQRTLAALQQQGKNAELVTYEGQPHAFDSAWRESMERTVAFFNTHLEA